MIGLKKYFGDELLQLTIILSLLRADPSRYINFRWSDASAGDYEVVLGPSLAYAQVDFMNVHNRYNSHRHCAYQKNIESVIIDQEALFYELNLLGRYGRRSNHPYAASAEITTYLLNGQGPTDPTDSNGSGGSDGNSAASDSDVQQAEDDDGEPEGHGHFDGVGSEERRRGTVVGRDHDYATLEPDAEGASSCDVRDEEEDVTHGLTKEDMDLIEIWMRQDIDLGVTRDAYDPQYVKDKLEEDLATIEGKQKEDQDQIAENECVEDAWSSLKYTIDSETGEHVAPCSSDEESALVVVPSKDYEDIPKEDPVIKEEVTLKDLEEEEEDPLVDSSLSELLDRILREEQAVDAESTANIKLPVKVEKEEDLVSERDLATEDELVDTLDQLDEMLQTAQLHHPHPHHGHPRSLQARMPYLRSMSMEQRWQDLANLLSLPNASAAMHPPHHHHHHHHPAMHVNTTGHHHHHHHHHHHPTVPPPPPPPHHAANYSVPGYAAVDNRTSVLLQNATLPAPVADINSNLSYQGEVGVGDPSNITAALVTSLTTLTNGTESLNDSSHHGHYQMDSASALMYPGNHSEVNQTTDGFLSAILNDEDLQLMDMAMNEGMYTMRMLENDDAMETSSDSAVSSMGSSERQEWMETNSESSPHPEDQQPERYYGMDYPQALKYRHYPYGYPAPGGPAPPPPPGGAPVTANGTEDPAGGLDRRIPPVAQKKYQLFGKRLPMDQAVGATSYNGQNRTVVPGIAHNHGHGHPSATTDQSIVSSSLAATAGVTVNSAQVKYPDYSLFAAPQTQQQTQSQQSQVNVVTPYGVVEGATVAPPILESLESKYSCSVEFARHHNGPRSASATSSLDHVQHNHTYQLTPDSLGGSPRPSARDKARKKQHDEHLSRDEKRARALKIPMNNDEIINLPMDEFNERLSKYDLTEPQLALIRDIRRRGKNKVAAQNCRKRKLDQILVLADEVTNMQSEKDQLLSEQQSMMAERQRLKDKFAQLYRHVFQTLRDPDGNPYSPYEYSLQQAADGNILLVPRNATNGMELDPSKGAKNKRRDDGKK